MAPFDNLVDLTEDSTKFNIEMSANSNGNTCRQHQLLLASGTSVEIVIWPDCWKEATEAAHNK